MCTRFCCERSKEACVYTAKSVDHDREKDEDEQDLEVRSPSHAATWEREGEDEITPLERGRRSFKVKSYEVNYPITHP